MSLEAFLKRLFAQNEHTIKLGLEPMHRALELCRLPDPNTPLTALVAGTNGKGATASALAAITQTLGLRTGLATSPHLVHYTERMRIQGQPLAELDLLEIGPAVLAHFGGPHTGYNPDAWPLPELSLQDGERPVLTFFELTLLISLIAFARARTDANILEIGLGGRLDASNAIPHPSISVITHIGLDHQAYLGDTLTAIAREKAGILRPHIPAIFGVRDPEALDALLKAAQDIQAGPVRILDKDFSLGANRVFRAWNGAVFPLPDHPQLALQHQRDNVACALAASLALDLEVKAAAACEALERWRWPGRWTWLKDEDILLDAAHNPDGARALVNALEQHEPRPCVVIFGALKDKDAPGIVEILNQHSRLEAILVAPIASPRAESPAELCARVGLPLTAAVSTLEEGLERARSLLQGRGFIVLTGSIYLLGEALQLLDRTSHALTTYHV